MQFRQIHFAIWTNTLSNLDKYIKQFRQIDLAIWTNVFCNVDIAAQDSYFWQLYFLFGQIHLVFWTNIFLNLDKYILQFGQIHFGQQPETKDNPQNQILDPKSQKHNPETLFILIFKTIFKCIDSIPNLEIMCSFHYTMSRSKDRQNWRVLIFKIEQEHPGDVII